MTVNTDLVGVNRTRLTLLLYRPSINPLLQCYEQADWRQKMNQSVRVKSPRWEVDPEPDSKLVSSLAGAVGIPANIIKILANRGTDSPEAIQRFLEPKISDL